MTDWIQHPTAVPFSQDAMNDPYGADRVKAFHAHLDVCAQCRDNPFALCTEGAKLLKAAA